MILALITAAFGGPIQTQLEAFETLSQGTPSEVVWRRLLENMEEGSREIVVDAVLYSPAEVPANVADAVAFDVALRLARTGKLEEASPWLERVSGGHPELGWVHHLQGLAALERGQAKEAVLSFQKQAEWRKGERSEERVGLLQDAGVWAAAAVSESLGRPESIAFYEEIPGSSVLGERAEARAIWLTWIAGEDKAASKKAKRCKADSPAECVAVVALTDAKSCSQKSRGILEKASVQLADRAAVAGEVDSYDGAKGLPESTRVLALLPPDLEGLTEEAARAEEQGATDLSGRLRDEVDSWAVERLKPEIARVQELKSKVDSVLGDCD